MVEQSEQRTARTKRILKVVGGRVTVSAGVDRGLSMAIPESGLRIGTRQDSGLRLSDPLASRVHADLTPTPEGIRVLDLGSSNGTFVGGLRIRDASIVRDTVLSIGDTAISVSFDAEPLELHLSDRSTFGRAVGHSRAMRHVFHLLEQAASSNATVLLEGASGTGKDVLALSLHEESERRAEPFVVVDCGAIAENLIESELYGHERGAFTGAEAARQGAFELAKGGTIFLDEIGELPLALQPKLLRVLENRSFKRVGGNRVVSTDVRVVAATNRNLRDAIRSGEFREDLFYRLSVLHIKVPPLSLRSEDIPHLAEIFLRTVTGREDAKLPAELTTLLASYHWPGNARELRNAVERFAAYGRVDPGVLLGNESVAKGDKLLEVDGLMGLPYHEAKRRIVEAFHAAFLPRVLERAGGSVSKAAELLQIPRPSVSRMLGAQAKRSDSGRTMPPPPLLTIGGDE